MKYILTIVSILIIQLSVKAQVATELITTHYALTQKAAQHIAELAQQEAVKNNWQYGELIYFTKMDDSKNVSVELCIAKAKHAANYRRDTKAYQESLAKGNTYILAMPTAMPVEGGVQLIYNGKTIGAIGVSGASAEEDGRVAKVGADFLLKARTNFLINALK
jgi:glc operon protein GlcG